MKILKSKHYPRFMYLMITIVIVLIFFSMLDLGEGIIKSQTGFAISEADNNTINNSTDFKEEAQLYSAKSYMLFYISLISLIAAIFLVFLSLRSSVLKNIEKEEKRNF